MLEADKMKILSLIILFFTSIFSQEKVTVAVSSNMQYAFFALQSEFQKVNNLQITPIISSSGTLTNQILNGAPFDIFLSADMMYPDTLFKAGFSNKPQIYAYGSLVLWAGKNKLTSINQLTNSETIAIANPKLAPYGKEAEKVMKKYAYGTKSKIIFGQNVGQVNNYIVTGVVDVGLTAKSVVLSDHNIQMGSWVSIPDSIYNPIAQGAVMINRNQSNRHNIELFYHFFFSEKGRDILSKFGYKFSTLSKQN